ncbi:MAG: hypothetical protein FAZ92_02860 [Accumulibacter sp.]|nr:MAG: hypothetical protein FAZ92_02860 [Accumulibacter sp.]
MARRGARLLQLLLQPGEFRVGIDDPCLQPAQLIAHGSGFRRHRAGSVEHASQQRGQVLDRLHVGDLQRAFLEVVLEVRARLVHRRELVDEGGQHRTHRLLRRQRALLGCALAADDILQAALDVVEAAQCQRRQHRSGKGIDLALYTSLIHAEHSNVVDDQLQQLEQGQPDFALFLGDQRDALAEGRQSGQESMAVPCLGLESLQQLSSLCQKGVVVVTEARQQAFDQAHQWRQQARAQGRRAVAVGGRCLALVGGRDGGLVPGRERHQRLLNALPAAPADRRLECRKVLFARLGAQPAQCGHELTQRCLGETGDVGQFGDLVVVGLVVCRRRQQLAQRQQSERLTGHFEGILRVDHAGKRKIVAVFRGCGIIPAAAGAVALSCESIAKRRAAGVNRSTHVPPCRARLSARPATAVAGCADRAAKDPRVDRDARPESAAAYNPDRDGGTR